ncbi:hypothetical protein [Paraburkholderia sp.]|uniref:hypothetical protein n=1 Tax=Paraburkholderia sp. TaxID=1926495 RepID=UPI00239EEC2E|nr:hypothetical protein [Paraburkholderia sp.]MDE1179236.1 hypothetical protein [Paraburkholderia sp.]
MSRDSFDPAIAAVSASPPSPPAPPDGPPPPKPRIKPASSIDSNSDPLMAALRQTLHNLGIDASTGVADSTWPDDDSDPIAASRKVSASGAQLIAAMYQALALQQSIAIANGLPADDAETSITPAGGPPPPAPVSSLGVYQDLGSRLSALAENAPDTSGSSDASSVDNWDLDFGDLVMPSSSADLSAYTTTSDDDDPMAAALSRVDDALQAHVAALQQNPDARASLKAVLDGMAGNTTGVYWQPVGVLVDVEI